MEHNNNSNETRSIRSNKKEDLHNDDGLVERRQQQQQQHGIEVTASTAEKRSSSQIPSNHPTTITTTEHNTEEEFKQKDSTNTITKTIPSERIRRSLSFNEVSAHIITTTDATLALSTPEHEAEVFVTPRNNRRRRASLTPSSSKTAQPDNVLFRRDLREITISPGSPRACYDDSSLDVSTTSNSPHRRIGHDFSFNHHHSQSHRPIEDVNRSLLSTLADLKTFAAEFTPRSFSSRSRKPGDEDSPERGEVEVQIRTGHTEEEEESPHHREVDRDTDRIGQLSLGHSELGLTNNVQSFPEEGLSETPPRKTSVDSIVSTGSPFGSITGTNLSSNTNDHEGVELDLDEELARLERQFLSELGQDVDVSAAITTPKTEKADVMDTNFIISISNINLDKDDNDRPTSNNRNTGADKDPNNDPRQTLIGTPTSQTNQNEVITTTVQHDDVDTRNGGIERGQMDESHNSSFPSSNPLENFETNDVSASKAVNIDEFVETHGSIEDPTNDSLHIKNESTLNEGAGAPVDQGDTAKHLVKSGLVKVGEGSHNALGTCNIEGETKGNGIAQALNVDDVKMEQNSELGHSFFDTTGNDSFSADVVVQFTTDQDESTIDARVSATEREDSFLTAAGAEARSFDATFSGESGTIEKKASTGKLQDIKLQLATNLAESTTNAVGSAVEVEDSFLTATAGSFDTETSLIEPSRNNGELKSGTLPDETTQLENNDSKTDRGTSEPNTSHPSQEEMNNEWKREIETRNGIDEGMDSVPDGTTGSPSSFEQGLGSSPTQTTNSTDLNTVFATQDDEADNAIQEALSLLRSNEEKNHNGVHGSKEESESMNATGSSKDILHSVRLGRADNDVEKSAPESMEDDETEVDDHVEDFPAAMTGSSKQEIENTAMDGNNSSSQELFFINDDSQGGIDFVESDPPSPNRKLGDSVSSIGETETFISPGDFFSKPKIALALKERHSLIMLPDASEVSFTSRAEHLQSELEIKSAKVQHDDGGRNGNENNDSIEKRKVVQLDDSQPSVAPPFLNEEVAAEEVDGDDRDGGGSHGVRDIFRPRDSSTEGDKRRMDFSAVSSVTSASSPNGVFHATGFISPIKLDESKIRSNVVYEDGSKPPLFPRNGTDRNLKQHGLNESRHQLSQHSKDESTVGYGTQTLSQFLKAEESASYNVEDSVFALMEDSSSSSLSPPGPGGKSIDEHSGESSSFGTESTPLSHSEVDEVHPGAAIWNMLSQNSPRRSTHQRKRPEFVLMPQSDGRRASQTHDLGASPSGSAASDKKGASFHRTASGKGTTAGLRPLGAGARRGRLLSRRVGESAISLSRRQLAFRLELQKALSDEAFPSAISPGDQQDSDSAFGGSLATDIFTERRPSDSMMRHSSPDLRILDKTPTALLDQIDNTSPYLFSRRLTRSHSVDFGGFVDRGGLEPLGSGLSHELISPRKHFDRSPASHSLNESVNSNSIPLDKQNIQFEDVQSEDDTGNDETHLEGALKHFSTLPPIEFPSTLLLHSGELTGYIGSLRWRQLVARFSHNEVFTISCKKPTSIHLDFRDAVREPERRDSSGALAIARNAPFELELQGQQWHSGDFSMRYANRDGLLPHDGDPVLPHISSFVTKVVGTGTDQSTRLSQPTSSPSTTRESSISEFVDTASKYEETLIALIEHVSSFAVETDFGYLPFKVSLKEPEAAEWKAKSKYSGDPRQVKDYLRGRIIFPDEGSLVCAIVKLFQLGDIFSFTSSSGEQKQVKLGIVRMKNMFTTEYSSYPNQTMKYHLPTGYRHILLNIVFNHEFIAEIQCNLLSLFAVLGEEGPVLHRDIRKYENACRDRSIGDKLLVKSIESTLCSDTVDLNKCFAQSCETDQRSLEEAKEEAIDRKVEAPQSASGDREGATTPVGDQTEPDTDHTITKESQDLDVGPQTYSDSVSLSNKSSPGTLDAPLERILFDAATPKAGRTVRQIIAPEDRKIPLPMTKEEIVDEIVKNKKAISFVDVCKAFLLQAIKHLEEHPRDVAALRCFFSTMTLISKISCHSKGEIEYRMSSQLGINLDDGVNQYTETFLKRLLAIGYQDLSVGMIGWVALMERGKNAAPRVGERPLEILHEIGACFAEQGKWAEAEDVYRTIVLRCERQLPLYHPVTIAGMLDLAACAIANSKVEVGNKIIARTSERVSAYMAEMEHSHTMHCQQSLATSQSGLLMFEIDKGRKALSMLEAFAERFDSLLSRKLMTLISSDHEVYLAQRCILADCFVVIANCWALKELSVPEKRSTHFWRSAFSHYRAVFRGSVKAHGLDDPRVASAAYGLARVLRELGKLSEALKVLTPVVKALSHTHGPDAPATKQSFSFIPQPITIVPGGGDKQMVTAQCQWLLAVLTADSSPDDDGRSKALKCLHKASIALRHILDTSIQEDPRRKECVRILRQIEEEARRIFQPLRRPTTSSHQS